MRKIIALAGIAVVAAAGFALASGAGNSASAKSGPTIVDVAASNPDFTTLVAAVQEANLVEVLDGRRQFTVFAPTNDAFAELGLNADNVDEVPDDVLTSILLYHVSPGNRESTSVVGADRIRTLNGGFLMPALQGNDLTIEAANSTATVVAADVDASNGVIHVIDTVLLP
jgi:uncharacterized surface protein with fasciclin (FAS1) repeats